MTSAFPESMADGNYALQDGGRVVVQLESESYAGYWFDTERIDAALHQAQEMGMEVHTLFASGSENWVERRIGLTNQLLYFLLPKGFPDYIDLPEDEEEEH